MAFRNKVLSLELIMEVLKNSGTAFRTENCFVNVAVKKVVQMLNSLILIPSPPSIAFDDNITPKRSKLCSTYI